MSHTLDGARLKVVWAQKHLDVLKVETGRWITNNPYVIDVEEHAHGWSGNPNIIREPPLEISAMVGDCLHNVACALDYVMWEIAGKFANRALIAPPAGKDKPYFPIWDTPGGFDGYIARLNNPKGWDYKIPKPVIDEFKLVQPSNAGYEPLWTLHSIGNVDKHRLPLVTRGEFQEFSFTTPTGATVSSRGLGGMKISIHDPTGSFRADPQSRPTTSNQPKVQSQATVYIAWKDRTMPREPVTRTIENIVKCVANIVPRFDGFFT